jgi:polyhydroxyalkanoate synthesis regulator phasin
MVRYGYSAQQVQSVIPDAVEGKDVLTVNYMDVHTLKIASLERRVKELEDRLKSTL